MSQMAISKLQQLFQHQQDGSHQTTFDRAAVGALLRSEFDIDLDATYDATKNNPERSDTLPGRTGVPLTRARFGSTEVFFYMDATLADAAGGLVKSINSDAIITTDTTSPPCEITEFVPLWLLDRSRPEADYYFPGAEAHGIHRFFDAQMNMVRSALVETVECPSTEMALIANGDAVRYHQDRLINQYRHLDDANIDRNSVRLVQQLSLLDWDMQDGTMSGTILQHQNGDRYVFTLFPGENVGFFFTEELNADAPTMMPFHCALPVLDRQAGMTVGAAKGKRLSALVRGLGRTHEVDALVESAPSVDFNDVVDQSTHARTYRNGARVLERVDLTGDQSPVAFVDASSEGLMVVELAAEARTTRVFRLEKQGEGFSSLSSIEALRQADRLVLINRSEAGVAYPLAFDESESGLPWIQLVGMEPHNAVEIDTSLLDTLRVTPTDEIFHRTALLDSFVPTPAAKPRLKVILDIVAYYKHSLPDN